MEINGVRVIDLVFVTLTRPIEQKSMTLTPLILEQKSMTLTPLIHLDDGDRKL